MKHHCQEHGKSALIANRRSTRRARPHHTREVARPIGCVDCRMPSYLGRAGIHEMLTFTSKLRRQIGEDKGNTLKVAAGAFDPQRTAKRSRRQLRSARFSSRTSVVIRPRIASRSSRP